MNTSSSDSSLHWADGLLLLVVLFWGGNFAAVKFGLAEIPPNLFNALRYFVAALVMAGVAVGSRQSWQIQRKHWLYLVVAGILGNSGYPLFFIFGLDATSADNSVMIVATGPVWVAMLGTMLGMERLSKQGWFGVGLSIVGILLVILNSNHEASVQFGGASTRGDLLILGAVLCWSGYTLAIRPLTFIYPPILLSAITTSIGIVPMLLYAAPSMIRFEWHSISWAAWASLLVTGIFAVGLAYIFWNYGVAHLGSTRTSLYLNVVPPIALFINWLWLGEVLTTFQWIGAIVALVGVGIARRHTTQLSGGVLERLVGYS